MYVNECKIIIFAVAEYVWIYKDDIFNIYFKLFFFSPDKWNFLLFC